MKRVFSSGENLPQRKKYKAEDHGKKSVVVQWYVIFLSQKFIILRFIFIDRSIDQSIVW